MTSRGRKLIRKIGFNLKINIYGLFLTLLFKLKEIDTIYYVTESTNK